VVGVQALAVEAAQLLQGLVLDLADELGREALTFAPVRPIIGAPTMRSWQDPHVVDPKSADRNRLQPVSVVPVAEFGRRGDVLPASLTTFVGRERHILAVAALLRGPETRLVTLVGAGGVGKTRLAIQVADRVEADFADGVRFVDLSAIADPALVVPTIAAALGLRESGDRAIADQLIEWLAARGLLLVLDNFEQVVEAASKVADLLVTCPGVTILVTSRVVLRISGEHVFPVEPLELPDPDVPRPLAALAAVEAVDLFVQRARAADPSFAVTEDTAATVADIVRRLDGLPLAIELAAARVRALSLPALHARLTDRLRLLTGGARDRPDRQRTIRDTIAWSYDLLSPEEQACFRRLAVFVGGCTLSAAEAVVGDEEQSVAIVDHIALLVDQSLLVRRDDAAGESRYLMLETVREYGLDRLAATGEEAPARAAHAAWCLALAEQVFHEVLASAPDFARWLPRYDAELDNLRAALAWFAACEESVAGLRLARAVMWFWRDREFHREGLGWLERFLAAGAEAPVAILTQALLGAGWLAFQLKKCDRAAALADAALPLARQRGDVEDNDVLLLWALALLGAVALDCDGDHAAAVAHNEEYLALARTAGLTGEVSSALHNLGIVAYSQGDIGRARALHEEAVALARATANKLELGNSLGCLAMVLLRQGNLVGAARLMREERVLARELGIDSINEGIAVIAAADGQAERAARLYGAIEARAEQTGLDPLGSASYRPTHERAIAAVRADLGEEAFAEARAAGAALPLEAALDEADAVLRDVADAPEAVQPAAPAAPGGLSPRELEVVRLLAAGRSNHQIADALFISPATAMTHVRNILAKLGLDSRTAVAAWAIRHGLD
jgi:non-specific serine/threonine protein kinase